MGRSRCSRRGREGVQWRDQGAVGEGGREGGGPVGRSRCYRRGREGVQWGDQGAVGEGGRGSNGEIKVQ